MTIDMAMRIAFGEQEAPHVDVPTFATTMDVTFDDVGERIDTSFTYRDVQTSGGDPQMLQQLQRAVAGMEGMSGTVSLSPRGEPVRVAIDTPTGLDPTLTSFVDQIETQWGQLTVPFPEEPLEVGGSWTATTSFEISGITTTVDADHTLDLPFPTRGTTSTAGTIRMTVRGGPSQGDMVQDIEMTIRLDPVALREEHRARTALRGSLT